MNLDGPGFDKLIVKVSYRTCYAAHSLIESFRYIVNVRRAWFFHFGEITVLCPKIVYSSSKKSTMQ